MLSFSGKGHVSGVHSIGLEIEDWHLQSTWIPCQAPCMCGCSNPPSMRVKAATFTSGCLSVSLSDLPVAPPPFPSGLCSILGLDIIIPSRAPSFALRFS